MSRKSNLYFGTGLCSRSTISQGIPFDILDLIFSAVLFLRRNPDQSVYHLIADHHALQMPYVNPRQVADQRFLLTQIISQITQKLNIEDRYQVVYSTEIVHYEEYQSTLKKLPEKLSIYKQLELADIHYFYVYKNVDTKLSWKFKSDSLIYDESFFDDEYKNIFPKSKINFLYVENGYSLNREKFFACPYIVSNPETRILISELDLFSKIKNISLNLSTNQQHIFLSYYQNIINKFNQITGESLPLDNIGFSISEIIDFFEFQQK